MALGGWDIGGTKIGVVLGKDDGEIIATDRIDTDPDARPDELLREASSRLETLRRRHGIGEVAALGVACPGPLSYRLGRLLEVPNMPQWQHFELRKWLDANFGMPCDFMNDANASVLAESYWGAARGVDNAVFLTMSTGMGAGLLLNGSVYEGPLALAGEIGHIRLQPDGPVGFGKRGSVEGFTSGPGIAQVARAEALLRQQRGEATALAQGEVSAQRVCELARLGDVGALAVVDRCGAELGHLCALLVDLLNPDVIVLGTIGSAAFDLWQPRVQAVLHREALAAAVAHVQLAPSGLADRGNQTALAVARRMCHSQR